MHVSLIIAKRGRDAHLSLCLHYLSEAAQSGGVSSIEVLIVTADEAAPTLAAAQFPGLSLRLIHRPTPPEALFPKAMLFNYGIAALRPGWDWCGLVDIDMIYVPTYFTSVARALSGGYLWLSGQRLSAIQTADVKQRRPSFAELATWDCAPFVTPSQIAFTPSWLLRYREVFGYPQLFNERFVGWGYEDTIPDLAASLLARAGLADKAVIEDAWYHLDHEPAPCLAQTDQNLALAVALQGEHQVRLRAYLQQNLPPRPAQALLERAAAQLAQGQSAQAEFALRQALALEPQASDVAQQLAVMLSSHGADAEAVALLRALVARDPGDALAWLNLGEVLRRQGRLNQAETALCQALALNPYLPEAQHNLGVLQRQQGRNTEAVAHFLAATRMRPGYAAAYYNLGNSLRDLGQLDQAVAAYTAALAAQPAYADAYLNLGATHYDLDQLDLAAQHYQQAAILRPDLVAAHRNLFQLYEAQGNLSQARVSGALALALEPANTLLRLGLETMLDPIAPSNAAIDQRRAELAVTLADWAAIGGVQVNRARATEMGGAPLFTLIYQGRDDRPLKQAYAALFSHGFNDEPPPPAAGPPRIGFVVTAGHEGVFLKCMGGLIERLPSADLRLLVFCGSPHAAVAIRSHIRRTDLEVLPIPRSLDRAAELIRAAACSLLYYWEVGTDTLNYLLPFCRLAQVQCTSWGWPVTSGNPALDYYLSSAPLEPADAALHYSERLALLPSLPTSYRRPSVPAATPPRSRYGLHDDENLYICTQNLRKIHPDFDLLVVDILRRDPCARVIFIANRATKITELLLTRLRAAMPDVIDRVGVLPQMPAADYLGLVAGADVVLDTLHYGGGANTCLDAAAAATPVVTLPGHFQRGRWALAIANQLEVYDGVASDPDDYVARALALGSDRAYRTAVSARIRAAAPALFEQQQPADELAACLLRICAS